MHKSNLVSDVRSQTLNSNALSWQPRDVIVVQPIIVKADRQPLDPVRQVGCVVDGSVRRKPLKYQRFVVLAVSSKWRARLIAHPVCRSQTHTYKHAGAATLRGAPPPDSDCDTTWLSTMLVVYEYICDHETWNTQWVLSFCVYYFTNMLNYIILISVLF